MILSFYFIDYLKYYIIKATKTRRILRYYKYSLKYFQLYYKKHTTTIFSIFNIYKKEQLCYFKVLNDYKSVEDYLVNFLKIFKEKSSRYKNANTSK